MSTDAKQIRRQQSHERILEAAARALCRDGFAGVGVASVMKDAGMTHGGFYAHFESREALLAEAVEHAGAQSMRRLRERLRARVTDGATPLSALVEEYLSEVHVNALDGGCPVAALGPDLQRGEPELRGASSRRVQQLIGLVEQSLPPGSAPGSAMVVVSTMIGAVQMARMVDSAQRSAMLRHCRDALISQFDAAVPDR